MSSTELPPAPTLHIIKLSVGPETLDDLAGWQALRREQTGEDVNRHLTRNFPRRGAEILESGGSIYWVIKGVILCRQRIVRLEEIDGADGVRRCGIVMDAEVIRTEGAARRPFQGWRYLDPGDAPRDLPKGRAGDSALPEDLALALSEIGLR